MATKSIDASGIARSSSRASPWRISRADGWNVRTPPGSFGPRSASSGPAPSRSADSARDGLVEHRDPARVELEADRPPRTARDRRAEQRPADARERVQHQLARPGEELDQPGHQPGRLVRPVDLPPVVAQLRRVGRRPHRLREVEPLLAGELVELVLGVRRPAGLHPGRVPVGPVGGRPGDCRLPTIRRCREGSSVAGSSGGSRSSRGSRPPDRRRRRAGGDASSSAGGAGMGASRFLDQASSADRGRRRARRRSCAAGPMAPSTRRGRPSSTPSGPPSPTRPHEELLGAPRRDAGPLLVRRCPDRAPLAAAEVAVRAPASSRTPSAGSPGRSRRSSGGSAGVPWSAPSSSRSRTCTSPMPRPARSRPSSRGSRARSGLPWSLTYQPDRLTREHPLRENLAVIEAGLRAPVRWTWRPLSRARDRGADRGDRGRAAVRVDRRPRGRAVRRLPLRRRGADRRPSRAASASLTGTLADDRRGAARPPLPGVPPRAPAARPVAAPDETATDLARRGCRVRGRGAATRPGRRARSPTGAAAGADGLDADLAAGLDEAIEHGFVIPGADDGCAFRHELVARARRRRPPADQRPRYHAALARAFAAVAGRRRRPLARAHRPAEAAGRRHRRRAGWRSRLQAPLDALASGTRPRPPRRPAAARRRADGDARAPRRGAARRRRTAPRRLAVSAQLAAEAAAAAGRPGAPRSTPRARSRRSASGRDRLQPRGPRGEAGPLPAARPATWPRARPRRCARRPTSCRREPIVERARILALLAQERMIAARLPGRGAGRAGEALEVTRAVGPDAEPEAIHADHDARRRRRAGATTRAGRAAAPRGARAGVRAGLIDEGLRASANLTRPARAARAARGGRRRGVPRASPRRGGGPRRGLRQPARRERGGLALRRRPLGGGARAAASGPSTGARRAAPFVNAIVNLVDARDRGRGGRGGDAGCSAGSSWSSRRAATSSSPSRPTRRPRRSRCGAATSPTRAGPPSAAGRALKGTEDWVLDRAHGRDRRSRSRRRSSAEALERRRIGDVAASRERAGADPRRGRDRGRAGSPRTRPAASREASLATARAFHARLDGPRRPGRWAAVAGAWRAIGEPYRVAMARWRQAEAIAGRRGRRRADACTDRRPPRARRRPRAAGRGGRHRAAAPRPAAAPRAARARGSGADPAPARGRRAARRAGAARRGPAAARRLARPSRTAPARPEAPAARPARPRRRHASGCPSASSRSLALIAQGRTNREIGDRLFISQKTVGVHVGNILAKLGVSGRVEAAAVAIRLGLEGNAPPARLSAASAAHVVARVR